MKSFSLSIPSATPETPQRRNEEASPLSYQTFDQAWHHCSAWLEERRLCTPDQTQQAIDNLIFKRDRSTDIFGPRGTSLLFELIDLGHLASSPREAAVSIFRHQRWDFIRQIERPLMVSKDQPEIYSIHREMGMVIIGLSKRILTIAHSDPWIAHLGLRYLQTHPPADAAGARATGVVNIPIETHLAIFEAQYGGQPLAADKAPVQSA